MANRQNSKGNKKRNSSFTRRRDENYDPSFEKKLRKFLRDSAENIATLKKRGDRKR